MACSSWTGPAAGSALVGGWAADDYARGINAMACSSWTGAAAGSVIVEGYAPGINGMACSSWTGPAAGSALVGGEEGRRGEGEESLPVASHLPSARILGAFHVCLG